MFSNYTKGIYIKRGVSQADENIAKMKYFQQQKYYPNLRIFFTKNI